VQPRPARAQSSHVARRWLYRDNAYPAPCSHPSITSPSPRRSLHHNHCTALHCTPPTARPPHTLHASVAALRLWCHASSFSQWRIHMHRPEAMSKSHVLDMLFSHRGVALMSSHAYPRLSLSTPAPETLSSASTHTGAWYWIPLLS
jgi:hypothetical protein